MTSSGELNIPVTGSAIIRLCHSKVAGVLKFEHFVAPAGPSRLKTPGEQLQTPGFSSDVWLQHVWRTRKRRRGMTTDGVNKKSGAGERHLLVAGFQSSRQLVFIANRMGKENPFFQHF